MRPWEWFDLDRAQIEAYEAEAAAGLQAVMTSAACAAPIEAATPEDGTVDTSSGGRQLIAQLLSDQPSAGLDTQVDEGRRVVAPRVILCGYCHQEVADMECPECEAVYCDDCHRVLHFNRKRRNHKCKILPTTKERLWAYAYRGNTEGVLKAANMGVDVDLVDESGRAAIHFAVASG